jgi:MerR family transcriptional regulator, light-induced transcriptional regulator
VTPTGTEPNLRIGELSRRVGVSPELLRAWERRYGLLEPARTGGGLRLYSADDVQRVRAMQAHLQSGLSAAEAARLARAGAASEPPAAAEAPALHDAGELCRALDVLDAQAAHLVLDRMLARYTLETVLAGVVIPYLRDLGDRWERGEASVTQEHFASNLLRGRLLALARGWERGAGPAALLACAPGEQHDLPLIMFGLALREQGWRIAFLGADTPVASVAEAAERLDPALVVVSAVRAESLARERSALRALARDRRLALAGAGADAAVARAVGAELLAGDPVSAAAAP